MELRTISVFAILALIALQLAESNPIQSRTRVRRRRIRPVETQQQTQDVVRAATEINPEATNTQKDNAAPSTNDVPTDQSIGFESPKESTDPQKGSHIRKRVLQQSRNANSQTNPSTNGQPETVKEVLLETKTYNGNAQTEETVVQSLQQQATKDGPSLLTERLTKLVELPPPAKPAERHQSPTSHVLQIVPAKLKVPIEQDFSMETDLKPQALAALVDAEEDLEEASRGKRTLKLKGSGGRGGGHTETVVESGGGGGWDYGDYCDDDGDDDGDFDEGGGGGRKTKGRYSVVGM